MTIAIALVLRPSRLLQCITISFALLLTSVAVAIAGLSGHGIWLRTIAAVACMGAAAGLVWRVTLMNCRRWRITVDGHGRFHFQSPQSSATSVSFSATLQPETVVWPSALFLVLRRRDNDNMINLVVLSDALGGDEFRRLSIACRWVMAHATSKAVPDL